MPRILISYRREDSAPYAGRLFDRLSDSFGADNIFIDIDALKPGQDFIQTIGESVFACDAVLAVIGKRWLGEKDVSGQRRLDRPDDLVRMEIVAALNRGIQVIPVLVGGAEMPQPIDLPSDLTKLGRLQALELSDARFHHDVHRLIEALARIRVLGAREETHSAVSRKTRDRLMAKWGWGVAAAAVIVVLWTAYRHLPIGGGSSVASQGTPTGGSQDIPRAPEPAQAARQRPVAPNAQGANPTGADSISAALEGGIQVVQAAPPPVRALQATGTIDKPQPIDLGVTYKLTLDDVETAYLSVPVAVSGIVMVLDMRPSRPISTNLQGEVSVLDRDGGVLQANVIDFNEIDWGFRKAGVVVLKEKSPLGLKLLNGGKPNTYWLTVFNTARIPFVPFFGGITPAPLAVGQSVSGALDAGDDVYYSVTLKKGNYKAVLDFAISPQRNTNIQGYLAILDAAGVGQRELIGFNQIDVAYRKIGGVTIKRDGPAIMRVQNQNNSVKYTLRIIPDEGS